MTFLDTSDLKNEEIALRLDHTFPGDPVRNWVPAYYFDILDATGQKVGICDLRIGHNEGLYYGGNIGYAVDEPFRGNHYAEKACRLLRNSSLTCLIDQGEYNNIHPTNKRVVGERLADNALSMIYGKEAPLPPQAVEAVPLDGKLAELPVWLCWALYALAVAGMLGAAGFAALRRERAESRKGTAG